MPAVGSTCGRVKCTCAARNIYIIYNLFNSDM